jgi:hypothetical protein
MIVLPQNKKALSCISHFYWCCALKGNQVKILSGPAAVMTELLQICHWETGKAEVGVDVKAGIPA